MAAGYDERGTGDANATLTERNTFSGSFRQKSRRRGNHARALHRGDDLGPDRDHPEKQADRGQCGGFFNDGAKHDVLPTSSMNEKRT